MNLNTEREYADELVVTTPAGVYAFDVEFSTNEEWVGSDAEPCFNCDYEGRGRRCTHMTCTADLEFVEISSLRICGDVSFFPVNEQACEGYPMPAAAVMNNESLMARVYEAARKYVENNAEEPTYKDFTAESW